MGTLTEYIRDYGDVSFTERPLCDADVFLLNYVSYVPLEEAVKSSIEPSPSKTLCQVAEQIFAQRERKFVPEGLILNKNFSKRLVEAAATVRFGPILITGCKSVFDPENNVQFAGITMLTDDNKAVIVFRGTDDTFVGWKEDMDILLKGTIPSYSLSVEYLNSVADVFPERELVVGGHSKGGNVALYAGLHCRDDVRSRIVGLYNLDGPGFSDDSEYDSDEYRQLLPVYRHFVPKDSLVGMLLAHDDDINIVNSSAPGGAFQHDLASWGIIDGEPEILSSLGFTGKIHDITVKEVSESLTKEQLEALYSVLCTMMDSTRSAGLLPMAKNFPSAVIQAGGGLRHLGTSTHVEFVKAINKILGAATKNGIKLAAENTRILAEAVSAKLSSLRKAGSADTQ